MPKNFLTATVWSYWFLFFLLLFFEEKITRYTILQKKKWFVLTLFGIGCILYYQDMVFLAFGIFYIIYCLYCCSSLISNKPTKPKIQPIPAPSSPFQHIPDYFSLFQPIPAHYRLSSLWQLIPSFHHFTIRSFHQSIIPLFHHSIIWCIDYP